MSRYLHFEFRADSFSGATDTVTVEATWIDKNGDITSLGTFVSLIAVPEGDAPWKIIDIDVSGTIPKNSSGRLQLKRVSGNDNAHFRNVWLHSPSAPPTEVAPWAWAEYPYVSGTTVHASWDITSDPSSYYGAPNQFYAIYIYVRWTNPDGSIGWVDSGVGPAFPGVYTGRYNWSWSGAPAGAILLDAEVRFYPFTGAADDGHVQLTWSAGPAEFGEYPKTFPYIPDVEDGIFAGTTILNDGGSGGQEYFAESGEPIDPSAFNYSVNWGSKTVDTYVHDYDNWINTGALWNINGTGAYMSGYSTHKPFGTSLFSMLGKDWYPALRSDRFVGAPHHNIDMYVTTAGSRGMALIGPIWGWNSWSDYFFAVNGGHNPPAPGVYRVQGGVATFLGPLDANSLGGELHVRHDFLTGALHVWTKDFFMGGLSHYYGTHPHSVGAGHAGWLSDKPGEGIFGDTTWCGSWQTIFEPGHIAHQRQFSMETLSVVEQDPPTWYFGQQITPPLRQRARDDGLATDSRQEKGQGSSQQLSLRRGGRVYY